MFDKMVIKLLFKHHHILILLVLLFSLFNFNFCKGTKLKPLRVKNIGEIVKEPSGLTYCNTTNSLYAICDRGSCHYIYELSLEGELKKRLEFNKKNFDDLEGVACDDINKLLYICEEGKRVVTSFYLDNYAKSSSYNHVLKTHNSFEVPREGAEDDSSGLEGITVLPNSNIIVTNEKRPGLLLEMDPYTKQLVNKVKPSYAKDYSGVSYDPYLNKMWVLSDQSQELFLTDLTGGKVYDYWQFEEMRNSEGIAVNETHLFIVTDPSSPSGKQYLPLFYTFYKPLQGTGRNYGNVVRQDWDCIGCSTIDEEIQELKDEGKYFRKQKNPNEYDMTSLIILVVASVGGIFILTLFIGSALVTLFVKRIRSKYIVNKETKNTFILKDVNNSMIDEDNEIGISIDDQNNNDEEHINFDEIDF